MPAHRGRGHRTRTACAIAPHLSPWAASVSWTLPRRCRVHCGIVAGAGTGRERGLDRPASNAWPATFVGVNRGSRYNRQNSAISTSVFAALPRGASHHARDQARRRTGARRSRNGPTRSATPAPGSPSCTEVHPLELRGVKDSRRRALRSRHGELCNELPRGETALLGAVLPPQASQILDHASGR